MHQREQYLFTGLTAAQLGSTPQLQARTWAGTGCHARLPVQEHGDGDLTAPCPCRRIRAAKRMALDPPATHEFVRPAHQALVWSLSVAAWAGGREEPSCGCL